MSAFGATRHAPTVRRTQCMGGVSDAALVSQRIAHRLVRPSNVHRGLLVFVDERAVYAVRPDSGLAESMRAAQIVGVYRGNASASQIADDLRAWANAA